jgi:hypothetical protein
VDGTVASIMPHRIKHDPARKRAKRL